jgi:hypothetical protein
MKKAGEIGIKLEVKGKKKIHTISTEIYRSLTERLGVKVESCK